MKLMHRVGRRLSVAALTALLLSSLIAVAGGSATAG
ncbi:diacylglycerol acyltransferase/mycolyltransferase Ag85A, partial [Mycobacterium sp. ITM-2017-0098]